MRFLVAICLGITSCMSVQKPEDFALQGPRLQEPTRTVFMVQCISMLKAPVTHCLCLEKFMAKDNDLDRANQHCMDKLLPELKEELLRGAINQRVD